MAHLLVRVVAEVGCLDRRQRAVVEETRLAAEELDLDFSQVKESRVDTNISPNQGSTVGSTSIRSAGQSFSSARNSACAIATRWARLTSEKPPVSTGSVS